MLGDVGKNDALLCYWALSSLQFSIKTKLANRVARRKDLSLHAVMGIVFAMSKAIRCVKKCKWFVYDSMIKEMFCTDANRCVRRRKHVYWCKQHLLCIVRSDQSCSRSKEKSPAKELWLSMSCETSLWMNNPHSMKLKLSGGDQIHHHNKPEMIFHSGSLLYFTYYCSLLVVSWPYIFFFVVRSWARKSGL